MQHCLMNITSAEFIQLKSDTSAIVVTILLDFYTSKKDFLLFVDADMQFGADSVFRMLVDMIFVVRQHRLKDACERILTEDLPFDKIEISAKGFKEITAGPTGPMMIKRGVFDKLVDNPDLQIKLLS